MAQESRFQPSMGKSEARKCGQWREELGLVDFRGDRAFWQEVATKRIELRIVQEWNSWVRASEANSIEELIFHTDGAAQLTEAWPRRVASAGWGAIVFEVSPDGTHRRLLGAACAPCMADGQFSTSPAAELTAAAAIGLLLEEENSGGRVRRVCWIAESTYVLYVAVQKCKVSANAAWSRVPRMTRAQARHVCSHAGEPGNECVDVLAELGRRGLRWSPCLLAPALRASEADQEA